MASNHSLQSHILLFLLIRFKKVSSLVLKPELKNYLMIFNFFLINFKKIFLDLSKNNRFNCHLQVEFKTYTCCAKELTKKSSDNDDDSEIKSMKKEAGADLGLNTDRFPKRAPKVRASRSFRGNVLLEIFFLPKVALTGFRSHSDRILASSILLK